MQYLSLVGYRNAEIAAVGGEKRDESLRPRKTWSFKRIANYVKYCPVIAVKYGPVIAVVLYGPKVNFVSYTLLNQRALLLLLHSLAGCDSERPTKV